MPHNIDLILTLTGGLFAALVCGYLTHRVGLSPIVGYLVAGIIVGPNTPGFIADRLLADQMAEIGVILLMFGVGLHFHLHELLAVRRIAIPGAVGQSAVATALGLAVALALGWGWAAGLVYGLALSVASTVVLTRVLADNHHLHTPTGHIAVGWLVVEDLFTVVVLVLLPVLFGDGGNVFVALGLTAVKIAALLAVAVPIGVRVLPWILTRVALTKSRELFTLTVLVIALGIAVGSAKLFDVSMALGAFLAGMIVGRSEFSLRAAADALPMRDAFAVLFFVSVGMLLDPRFLTDSPGATAATIAVVLLAKPAIALVIVLLRGYPVRTALAVAIVLGQIGEFSFILATVGSKLKVLPDDGAATNALVAAAIVSISLNPLLYRAVGPVERWLARRPRLWRLLTARQKAPVVDVGDAERPSDPRFRAVVVGYGPVGRTLSRLLQENGIKPTIIEMNLETVRQLRANGLDAVYGDASRRETLVQVGIANAGTLVLSSSGMMGASDLVKAARELNPGIRVIARSAYLWERAALRAAGADEVYAGEGEVALAMAESFLRELGASPDQIDRERERVRGELFGDKPTPPEPGS
jgi:monovalent cation:H+ antiporter-2, CPA2 family